jgi:multisubunit Na+/H+ antiporter MnhG subunit
MMIGQVFATVVGCVGVAYGALLLLFTDRFTRIGARTQASAWGAQAGRRVTPALTRTVGVGMIVIGVIILVALLIGVF